MYEDLESFYGKLEDLDQWMDSAIERGQDLQKSRDDVENQFATYQVRTE